MQVGPGGSDQGEAEGGEARLAPRELQQRTAWTNLVTVASPPVSSQHRSRPLPFLSHTLLRAPFIPPPNAHVSPVLPALKHPGTSRCSPDKTQPPQSHGQPLAVWSSSLHPALDSCHAGPRPAHVTPSPRELPPPPAAGALWWASRSWSRPMLTCAGYAGAVAGCRGWAHVSVLVEMDSGPKTPRKLLV